MSMYKIQSIYFYPPPFLNPETALARKKEHFRAIKHLFLVFKA